MAWTTINDPWRLNSKHKGINAENCSKGFKPSILNCTPISSLVDDMQIDKKAIYIAQQLMLANTNQNRQCAAASTSALFHLAYHGGAKEVKEIKTVLSNIAKPEVGKHIFDEESGDGENMMRTFGSL